MESRIPRPTPHSARPMLATVTSLAAMIGAAPAAWAEPGVRVWLPQVVSTYGVHIDQLFYLILWITGLIFVLVEGFLVWCMVRYRRQPGRPAHYLHGNAKAEVIWTVVPALIVLYLAFASQKVWSEIQGPPPPHQVELEVKAEQFAWNVRYAGDDGRLNTADDVETINQLHLPVDQVALVHLTSKDVIHSFFLPEFRIKRDAVPGMTGRLWLQANKTGQFEVVCAELCGLGHYRMRGFLVIETPEAFQAWLQATKQGA